MTPKTYHLLRTGNPVFYALGGWITSGLCLLLGNTIVQQFGQYSAIHYLVIVLIIVTISAPFLALIQTAFAYKRNAISLERIIRLYGALLLICANINFAIQLHFSRDGTIPFRGMAIPWIINPDTQPQFSVANAFFTVIDSLYFSVVSLSTVGFGDITPSTWYARLAISIEILLGLSITVLTIGRHFSRKPTI